MLLFCTVTDMTSNSVVTIIMMCSMKINLQHSLKYVVIIKSCAEQITIQVTLQYFIYANVTHRLCLLNFLHHSCYPQILFVYEITSCRIKNKASEVKYGQKDLLCEYISNGKVSMIGKVSIEANSSAIKYNFNE